MTPPLNLRKLKAAMALKHLDLRWVASRAKVPYTSASEILTGRRVCPPALHRLSTVIESARMPEETAA
jgi:hypothetical protein